MPAHAPDLNRGHDKSLSFNLDQKTGEWKADFVRYRYKRDTELVVGCAGYAPTQLLLVIWPQTLASRMRPSAACFDHSVFSRFRVAPADACFSHCFCHHGVEMCGRAGDTKSSSLRRRGGTRSYGAGRAATVPSRTKPSGISWVAPTLHTGTQ
jgi:hypothetical protein